MLVKDLGRRLSSFPPKAIVRASVGDGPTVRTLWLERADHHRPPDDIAEGDTPYGHTRVSIEGEESQVQVHPVEIFAEPWFGSRRIAEDITVKDLLSQVKKFPDEAMLRVAVPVIGSLDGLPAHIRCLDVNGVGYAASAEEVNGELVVELVCERWDSGHPIIRLED